MTGSRYILELPVVAQALRGDPKALEYLRLYSPDWPPIPEELTLSDLERIDLLEWELYGKDEGRPKPQPRGKDIRIH